MSGPPERGEVWSAGAAAARRDWLLCLEAGDVPGEGWIGAVERFVAFAGEPRVGRLSRRPASAFVSQFFGAFAGVEGRDPATSSTARCSADADGERLRGRPDRRDDPADALRLISPGRA